MHTCCLRPLVLLLLAALCAGAAEPPWISVPSAQWKGATAARVPALKRSAAAAVALPARSARPLTVATADAQPAGLYEVRLTVRPSHVGDAVAFNSSLRVIEEGRTAAEYPGCLFARVHEPETRTCRIVHAGPGPLSFVLQAAADPDAAERTRTAAEMKRGGPKIAGSSPSLLKSEAGDDLEMEIEATLDPETAVYFVVDKVELRPLSRSGMVARVEVNKIRYRPGETLKGSAVVVDAGGKGGAGTLNIYLEHNVRDRVKMKSQAVSLAAKPQTLPIEITLPAEELGYALVAEYVSADGMDRSEAAEYFSIADNFQRVAIFGGGLATRDVVLDEETIRRGLDKARSEYFNACEYFAWAPDDMVEMSPAADFWSSGQTNYRMNKQTIQRQIRLAHEQGFAVATYGKFVMSGLEGWQTAYDYPGDHRGQYYYPVGMWEGVNVEDLDRRRDGDFSIYSKSPNVPGTPLRTWWSTFMPINPDATPRMVRIAAEECVRSIDMFGWDAIRWDGHPRAAGWVQCGRSGKYEAWAARQTQSLVRYFKEIVGQKHPEFRYGYNYLLIEKKKEYDWAVEDYELDELCRGGGLLMNESIGNASAGWTFAEVARNLQVDGDLCRERGGYYLGISFASRNAPRDIYIESALWAAAGCRPYNDAMSREVRRYCIRYSQYTFDERLRRLEAPEKVLVPQGETRLWWQPFVYETPLAAGRRQLVVNLLNLPLQDTRPAREGEVKPKFDMPPGTDPAAFALTLPAGLRATAANLIDPETLSVTPLALAGNRFEVPPVAIWQVAVIDLAADADAPSLASLCGTPKTFGVRRPGVKEEDRKPEVVLDPKVEVWEVNKRIETLAPDWTAKRSAEEAALDALTGEAREKALLARRQPAAELAKQWWKGASILADLALKDKAFDFGDLTPQRNGRLDVFYGRGAMDYRLSMPAVFGRLPRVHVHDARLWGAVRQSPGMGLADNVPWRRYPDFDLLLFTGIPHCAIGVENSYAMVQYVKDGGAVFFTGGEYAFGKGGYMHTVLERELLPLLCTGMVDTVYPREPLPFEPGPDFDTLGVKLDFSVKPSFWVRNEVVLKPGAKVFIKSGERPILVGRELGKGRVACLLVDYRGRTGEGVTAFFDWQDWPRLAEATVRWLTPEAGRAAAASGAADVKAVLRALQGAEGDDELAGIEKDGPGGGPELPGAEAAPAARELAAPALKQRLALIDRALAAGGPQVASALARQLTDVSNLPLATRLRILDLLRRERPASASSLGRQACGARDSAARGSGYLLLALAGDGDFARMLAAPQAPLGEGESAARERMRDLALAVALYPKADLVEEGRRRVAAWDREEARIRTAFAQTLGPDTAMLETSPCLDAEALFARLAWLAYLSRHDARTFAAPFIREWLMGAQYVDYCQRTRSGLIKDKRLEGARAAAVNDEWRSLAERFTALCAFARPDVEALMTADPAETGKALSRARFTLGAQAAMNLLGDRAPAASAAVLKAMGEAVHPDLAAFVAARLGERP